MIRRFTLMLLGAVLAVASALAQEDDMIGKLGAARSALAAKDYVRAIEWLDQMPLGEQQQPVALNLRGAALTELKRWQEAGSCFEMALERSPSYWPARFNLAELDFQQKDYVESERKYRAFLGVYPGNEIALYKLFLITALTKPVLELRQALQETPFPAHSIALRMCQLVLLIREGKTGEARHLQNVISSIYLPDLTDPYFESLDFLGWKHR